LVWGTGRSNGTDIRRFPYLFHCFAKADTWTPNLLDSHRRGAGDEFIRGCAEDRSLPKPPSHITGYTDTSVEHGCCSFLAEILGLGTSFRSMQDLDNIVTAGLPQSSLVRLSSRLYPNNRDASVFKFKVIDPATWKRRTKRLSRQESERIERPARVLAYAEYVLYDRDEARQWKNTAHRELDRRTPLESAPSEIGARRVESVLNSLFFGLPA
jgi:putative toxin-antitoxin system antitoxin component (TIGR02293 family)